MSNPMCHTGGRMKLKHPNLNLNPNHPNPTLTPPHGERDRPDRPATVRRTRRAAAEFSAPSPSAPTPHAETQLQFRIAVLKSSFRNRHSSFRGRRHQITRSRAAWHFQQMRRAVDTAGGVKGRYGASAAHDWTPSTLVPGSRPSTLAPRLSTRK